MRGWAATAAAPVELRILGSLELAVDGRVVPIAKRQHRRTLAALLVRSGELVSTDALIDALWPAGPPLQPTVTVHSAVARLRKAMEPDRSRGAEPRWLRTESPGYRLVVAGDGVDAQRFEAGLARGRADLAAGDPDRARHRLRTGLGEWRGPALAEFADEPFALGTARRLEAARLDAIEARIAADLACGDVAVVAELDALVAAHPFRERLWEHLLVALYRSGRQVDALRRFQDARRALGDAGLEPGPELVALDAAVARRDRQLLDWTPVTTETAPPAAPISIASWPAPPFDGSDPGPPFVGRDGELDWIDQRRTAGRAGQAAAVLVRGEPGIGKSRLLIEAAGRAAAGGALVLAGHCSEDPLLPHEPFVEALEPLVATAGDQALLELGEHRTHLARLLPGSEPLAAATGRDEPSPLEPDTARYLAYQAVAHVIGAAGRDRLTLLALDDLQWAEPSTLRLLSHVLGAAPSAGLTLLGAYRDTEVGPDHPLTAALDDLRRAVPVHERTIGGLSEAEVRRLVAHWGVHPTGPLATALHDSTDGHPLFVTELVGPLGPDWQPGDSLGVPETVRALIRRRTGRLHRSARELLDTASLIGRQTDASLLTEVLHRSPREVAADLDDALRAGLLSHADGTWSFVHDLIRDVLAEAAPPAGRAARHRAIGDAIAAKHPDPETHLPALAHHYARAAADGDPVAAVEFADRAGRQALQLLAHDEARDHFQTGLDVLERTGVTDEIGRLRLLIGVLEAQRRLGLSSGGLALGTEALDLARRRGTPVEVAGAASGAVSTTWDDEEAGPALADALEAALAHLGHPGKGSADGAARLQVMVLLMLVLARSGRHSDAVTHARRVQAQAGAVDDPDLQVEALTSALNVVVNEDPLAKRMEVVEDVLGLAGRSENRETNAVAYATARYLSIEAVDERAGELAEAYETAVDALGMPRYRAGRAQRRAMMAHLAGDFERAEAASEEMVGHQPTREFFEAYAAQLFAQRLAQGRLVELASVFEQLGPVGERPVWRAAQAWRLTELGEDGEAGEVLAPAMARLGRLPRDPLWLVTLVVAGHPAARVCAPEEARRLATTLEPEAHRVVVSGTGASCLGSVARVLGPLALASGDAGAAANWCRLALATHHRLGAPVYVVEDRLWLARCLCAGARAEPGESAGELVASALADAHRLGLGTRIVAEARRGEVATRR